MLSLRASLICSFVFATVGCSFHSVEPMADASCNTSELPDKLIIQDHYILCNGGVFKDMSLAQVLTMKLPSIAENDHDRQRLYRYHLPLNPKSTACILMKERRDQVVYLSDGVGLVKVPLYTVSQQKIECPMGSNPEDITPTDADVLLTKPVAPSF